MQCLVRQSISLAWALCLMPTLAQAHEVEAVDQPFADAFVSQSAQIKLGVESIKLPAGPSMGMVGVTYLVEAMPGLYLGPAAYGAVSGNQGGFFTVGGEVAWQQALTSTLSVQTGLYAGGGGGGGGNTLWGGGLMLRPHADLLWDFGGMKAGVTASYVDFPQGGNVHSSQLGVTLAVDTQFNTTRPDYIQHYLSVEGRQGFGFDRAVATFGSYLPASSANKNDGTPSPSQMAYAGVRLEQFLNPNLYWGIEAAGAASGGVAGYAEFLGTVGAETALFNNTTVGGRVSLGMGGGGGVSVGGGLLTKAAGYLTYDLTEALHFSLEGGYAVAPDGNFKAGFASGNVVLDLDHPYRVGGTPRITENGFIFGSEHYFNARMKSGDTRSLDLVTIRLNRYLNDAVYLTGQAHSAYNGGAGSYSVGLVGLGYRSAPVLPNVVVGAEMLVGAAGGGGVDSGGGAVVQPMAFVEYQWTRTLGLKVSAGEMKSWNGGLNTAVLDVAVNFDYGSISR